MRDPPPIFSLFHNLTAIASNGSRIYAAMLAMERFITFWGNGRPGDGMKNGHVLLIAFLIGLMFFLFVGVANAGSQSDPEVLDEGEPDTSDDDEDDDDIRWAWFDGENGTQVNCTLEMYSLPPVQTGLTTIEYEVYFSVGDANWVVVSIFNFGTGWTQAGYELRTVTYDENGSVTSESDEVNIDGDWDSNAGTITYFLVKDDVYLNPAGMITKPWAAVWRTPLGGSREQGDTAMSYIEPGRNYSVFGINFVDVALEDNVTAGETASFTIELQNPGLMTLNVTCNASYGGSWDITVAVDAEPQSTQEFTFTVLAGESSSVVVLLDVPLDPVISTTINEKPVEDFHFTFSYFFDDENATITQRVNMKAWIDLDPDDPSNGDDGSSDDDDGWLPGFEAALVALAIPAAVILSRKRR